MAELEDVLDTLILLVDANLGYPPSDIEKTARVWTSLLSDIPADTLKRAALDHIMTGVEFPKLSEIRERAANVKAHNGQSVTGNPFAKHPHEVPWAASVGKDHWYTFVIDPNHHPKKYTPLELLMMRDWETWTAQERAWFERETGEEAP